MKSYHLTMVLSFLFVLGLGFSLWYWVNYPVGIMTPEKQRELMYVHCSQNALTSQSFQCGKILDWPFASTTTAS